MPGGEEGLGGTILLLILLLLVLSQNDVLGTSGERGTKGSPREGWDGDRSRGWERDPGETGEVWDAGDGVGTGGGR